MTIDVKELICPIGFLLSLDLCRENVCDELLMTHKITNYCNIDTTSITIPNTTWLGVVSVSQDIFILYPSCNNVNKTFGFAPVGPTGYCKLGIT